MKKTRGRQSRVLTFFAEPLKTRLFSNKQWFWKQACSRRRPRWTKFEASKSQNEAKSLFSWRPALPPPSCVCSFLIYGRAGPTEALLNTIDASLQPKGTAFTGMVWSKCFPYRSHLYSNMCTKLLISFWAIPCALSISTVALNVRQEKTSQRHPSYFAPKADRILGGVKVGGSRLSNDVNSPNL